MIRMNCIWLYIRKNQRNVHIAYFGGHCTSRIDPNKISIVWRLHRLPNPASNIYSIQENVPNLGICIEQYRFSFKSSYRALRHPRHTWVKFGNIKDFVVLSDDVVAIASGIHVVFLNLTTREERIEKFDSPERGKGASCLAGHPVVPMFTTAERRPCPKICIFTYPGIRRVSSCILDRGPNGYLSCAFAGSEYLLSLTSFPDFRIIIWSWRTGENLTSIDTTITDDRQRIACSPTSPYQVSQLGEITGNFAVYEINVCSRIVMMSLVHENSSPMNKTVCASWSSDGNLFHCDINGNVTLNFNDGKRRQLIVRGEDTYALNSKGNCPLIEAFRTGVIVVDRNSQIVVSFVTRQKPESKFTNSQKYLDVKHYNRPHMFYRKPTSDNRIKSGTPWRSVWSIQATYHPIETARSSRRKSLLFCGNGGEIFELSTNDEDDSPRIRVIACQGSKYEFLGSVNPQGDQIFVIDEFDRLSILQCLTGQSVSNMCLKIYGGVRCATSHPKLPLVAIGTAIGKFVLVNLIRISQPSVARVIHLQKESLGMVRYSSSNTLLGLTDADRTRIFLIGSGENERYSVLGLLHSAVKIIDFLMYETDRESTKILVLAKTSTSREVGKKIIIYDLDNVELKEECKCVIELANTLDSLYYGRSRYEIIAVPYLTKQLNFLKIQEDFQGIALVEALSSGHQLRNIRLSMNDNFIVSCSYDGLIIARSKTNIQQVVAIFMSHHRLDGGAKIVILPSSNNTIVALGRNGDLTVTEIINLKSVENIIDPDDELALSAVQLKDDIEDDLTWVDRKVTMNLQTEREECAAERNSILEDFSNLRERLKLLLDTNEHESANCRLSISDFDLDQDSRAQKIHENIAHKTMLIEKLKNEIFQRDEVSNYLRKLCWDSMEIHACSLLSINGKTKIDNFPMPRVSKDQENRRRWESFIVEFEPFVDKSENTARNVIPESLSIMGTTTHRFLPETSELSINQIRECPSYNGAIRATIVMRDRERKLRIYFNQLFEDMRSVKDRELSIAARRLEEIERCAVELKNMFKMGSARNDRLLQPLWHYSEKPESIVTISESEIFNGRAAMYLERDVHLELARKREQESSKLINSFREEALEIMMDGLLEVRWEDEIKKDLPRPLCLSGKDPSNFTEEENLEYEMYRTKCQELERERQKYKKMLQDKIVQVEDALRHDAGVFDRKLETFYLDRMKIESAILQETSMRLRESQRHLLRRRGMEMVRIDCDELTAAVEDFRSLIDTSMLLESAVIETRNRYDNLSKRDKTMDVKFRGEFPDLKQPMVEHLLRHYRKRPKNVQLTCTSITYLTEIARCIVTCDKSEILPRDCSDFLRGMDGLDTMPNNLPAQIDTSHWNLLCKLRRAKVELEIKIKICAVDLAEAEQTFGSHQKCCAYAESKVSQLREVMKEREIHRREALEDMQVQLVLKMGQIECQLFGDPIELSGAVLVPLYVVERANNAILGAGRKKLAAMRKTIVFRRTTLWQEWRHKCMQITLGNMREELKVLQGVKFTREIQSYLMSELRDVKAEKKAKSCERALASTKKRFSRILKETRSQYDDSRRNVAFWRKRNKRNVDSVERMKLASFKASLLIHSDKRERDARYRRTKLKAIMRKTRLAKKVQENYGELLALQTQLELLRLKTYPTLRLKGLPRDKGAMNKRAD